jgi:hypothetical protein
MSQQGFLLPRYPYLPKDASAPVVSCSGQGHRCVNEGWPIPVREPVSVSGSGRAT